MTDEDRLALVCDQASPAGAATPGAVALTGIDFIQIVAPALQTRLRVFFIVDPDRVLDPDDPGVPAKFLAVFPTPTSTPAFPKDKVSIVSAVGESVPVTQARWRHVAVDLAGTQIRTVLEIDVTHPGDFSLHRLTLADPAKPPEKSRFDVFFNGVPFSFKQGCPSVFDCRRDLVCPDESLVDFPVDYLARDFVSLRNALMDFAAQKYPLFRERVPADQLVMIAELLAALGDELAYVQDWSAREGTVETAQEMRTLRRQCRLLDFDIDNGQSADTWLALEVKASVTVVPPGARVWAMPLGQAPVAYEIGRGLAERRKPGMPAIYTVDAAWNLLAPHIPDPGAPCLPFGATEIIVKGHLDVQAFANKPILIALDPAEAGKPRRRHIARVKRAEQGSDPLILDAAGAPQDFTRLVLYPDDALPFESCLPDTRVFANLLPAVAGETVEATFAIGSNASLAPVNRPDFPLAIEREGLLDATAGARATTFLFSLAGTEAPGLGWIDGRPEVELEEINTALVRLRYWDYEPSLLAGRGDDWMYTLEDGIYRRVIRFLVNGDWIEAIDRASGHGFTLRFGDNEFGLTPPDGTLFRVTYRTGPLAAANLAAETVTVLIPPIAAPVPILLGSYVTNVFNPLPITSGRDQMDLQTIKFLAPDAWRVRFERAVRDEDFREIAERLDWVSQAGARARWTGSWLTEFVTADPVGRYGLSPEEFDALSARMNCVRQAGRDVVIRDPVYAALDLFVQICVNANAHAGDVVKRVMERLVGPARQPVPFFDPSRFTFATPLSRLALEAAIQEVAGVRAVKDVRVRIRGLIDWQPLDDAPLDPGTDRIFRLQNDPDHPEAGSLLVTDKEWADAGMLSV